VIGVKIVVDLTDLSRTTIWRKVRDGEFPSPVQISKNRVAWREIEVLEWLQSRT
jgi:prophage regulatory protein